MGLWGLWRRGVLAAPLAAFVDHYFVAVGIADDGEAADGGVHGLDGEGDSEGFEAGDFGVEVVHFEGDAGALRGGLPGFAVGTDAKGAGADFVFHPRAACGFHRGF